MDEARAIGYARMRLDTMPKMDSAQRLYESLGFRDIAAYRYNPEPGARFLEVDLRSV
jgi:putative acetyltransferase